MSVRDDPQRIEIELHPIDGDTSPFRQPDDVVATGRPAGGKPSRGMLVGAAFGVTGLLAGWFIGRASVERGDPVGDGAAAVEGANDTDDTGPTENTEQFEAPTASSSAGDEATTSTDAERSDASVVPIAPVTPQTGDAEPMVTEFVDVPATIAGQPVEIVAYGNGRVLSRLDLSDGTLRTQQVQRYAFGPPQLLVGSDWVLMPSADVDLPAIVIDADGGTELVDVGPGPGVLTVTPDELVWSAPSQLGPDGGPLVAMSRDGTLVRELELPSSPIGADPAGGFVVEEAGGSYRVGAESTSQITSGALVALGRGAAVARECDAELVCGLFVIDRESSARRPIAPTWPGGADDPTLALVSTTSVSPDGERAMVEIESRSDGSVQPLLGVLTLSTGAVIAAGPAQSIEQATWTPDGRFVIYNSGGRVAAFDAVTAATTLVSDRLIGIDALAVRPAVGPAGS